MNIPQTTLLHYPLLPFARPRTPRPGTFPTTSATSPASRGERPASLWRDSLKVGAGRLGHAEDWAFFALAAFVLPAAAISQSALWHLLDRGVLTQVIRAFLLAGDR